MDARVHRSVRSSTLRSLRLSRAATTPRPTIAAYAYKKSIGQPFLYPDNSLGLVHNILRMTFGLPMRPYQVDPVAANVLDLLLMLHTNRTARRPPCGSSLANLFASISSESMHCSARCMAGRTSRC